MEVITNDWIGETLRRCTLATMPVGTIGIASDDPTLLLYLNDEDAVSGQNDVVKSCKSSVFVARDIDFIEHAKMV